MCKHSRRLRAGWIVFFVVLDFPEFMYVTYDPVNGCVALDYTKPSSAALRWYAFAWSIFTYPVPLFFASVFNAAAVYRLRADSRHLVADEKAATRSDVVLKRRAALGLQRASIALVVIFAVTSGPFQVTNAMQSVIGTKYSQQFFFTYVVLCWFS